MNMTRRDFLKWAGASAALLGLTAFDLQNLEKAIASTGSPPVLWLHGAACTGCTISLLNNVNPTIDDVLLNKISMKYHSTLNVPSGELAIKALTAASNTYAGQFILVVEGAIPTANLGKYCIVGERNGVPWTALDALKELGPKAKQVIAVGTCASFKGIPGAGTNAMAVKSVKETLYGMVSKPVINLPGCPVHPASIVGTLVDVITGVTLALDGESRPTKYYGNGKIHSSCPRKSAPRASEIGTYGCYSDLNCKGKAVDSNNLCPTRKWNNGVNWCINANVPCVGCSAPSFPAPTLPLYKK